MDKIGRYELRDTVGSGAMGTVFKGYDEALDRFVAIKTMSAHLVVEEETRSRFLKEAKALARLHHPNIVTIHELGEHGGAPYIAMEFLDGKSLKALMDSHKLKSFPAMLKVLIQVSEGLDYAHKLGVIHRDVKPANIIVSPSGDAKLVDFGIAWLAGSTMHTRTGVTMGTVAYMSPEQAKGEKVDHRADQFSAGVIAYELISGANPFKAENFTGVLQKIIFEAPTPLKSEMGECPPRLAETVMRALEKDRERRFPDMAAFAEACRAVLRECSGYEWTGDTAPQPAAPSETAVLRPGQAAVQQATAAPPAEPHRPAAAPPPPAFQPFAPNQGQPHFQAVTPHAWDAPAPPPRHPPPRAAEPTSSQVYGTMPPFSPSPAKRAGFVAAVVSGGAVALAGLALLVVYQLGWFGGGKASQPRTEVPAASAPQQASAGVPFASLFSSPKGTPPPASGEGTPPDASPGGGASPWDAPGGEPATAGRKYDDAKRILEDMVQAHDNLYTDIDQSVSAANVADGINRYVDAILSSKEHLQALIERYPELSTSSGPPPELKPLVDRLEAAALKIQQVIQKIGDFADDPAVQAAAARLQSLGAEMSPVGAAD